MGVYGECSCVRVSVGVCWCPVYVRVTGDPGTRLQTPVSEGSGGSEGQDYLFRFVGPVADPILHPPLDSVKHGPQSPLPKTRSTLWSLRVRECVCVVFCGFTCPDLFLCTSVRIRPLASVHTW